MCSKHAVDRALNIAMTEPKGPVYLTLPREVLAAPMIEFHLHLALAPRARRRRRIPTRAPSMKPPSMIARAESPLIITSSAGRDEATWPSSPRWRSASRSR